MDCLDWLERLLRLLWIPEGDKHPPYRGMPLVILALDESIMNGKSIVALIPLTSHHPHSSPPHPSPPHPSLFTPHSSLPTPSLLTPHPSPLTPHPSLLIPLSSFHTPHSSLPTPSLLPPSPLTTDRRWPYPGHPAVPESKAAGRQTPVCPDLREAHRPAQTAGQHLCSLPAAQLHHGLRCHPAGTGDL